MLRVLVSGFLILVILVQRGRGGGLTGALGGMGGQSAFGTKAGDLFTKITIVVALMWGLSAMGIIYFVGGRASTGGLSDVKSPNTVTTPSTDKSKSDKTKSDEKKTPAVGVSKGTDAKATKTPETKTPSAEAKPGSGKTTPGKSGTGKK